MIAELVFDEELWTLGFPTPVGYWWEQADGLEAAEERQLLGACGRRLVEIRRSRSGAAQSCGLRQASREGVFAVLEP